MVNEKSGSTNTNSTQRTGSLDASFVNEDFDTFLDNYDYHFSPGDIVAGTVFSLEQEGALIDIGAKTAAYIPIQEMSISRIDSPEEVLQRNETREFFILADENEDGQLTLSIRRIEYMRAWERLRQMQAEDVTIRATVFATNQGGALVRVEGLRGFIPGLHISTHKPKEELVGEELLLKFLEVDEEKNRLVLSHRRALVERKMNRLEVGEVVSGTVRGIKPYGAFIDIGGVSALLPVSEISHVSIENPGNVFQVNDEIKVIILDLDAEKGRISVSTKALELEPGDMLRNPQQVYEHAEEATARYLNSIRASSNLDQDEEIGFYDEEIISYEQALQEISQEQFPEEWAATQVKLANTYLNRTKGDRAENLEQAIAACESVLQIYTRETFPEEWAKTQSVLTKAYYERIRGDRAENLEQAITAGESALQIYTREAFPEEWAATQMLLGKAYLERIQGDRPETLEQAITGLLQALRTEDASVRRRATDALGKLGSEQAVPALLQALNDEASGVRWRAVDALGRIGSEQAIPGLLQSLDDEDYDVRWRAVNALGNLGSEQAIPGLLQALDDEASGVRWRTVEALGKLGSEAAIPGLLQALEDQDAKVRSSAAEAIGKIALSDLRVIVTSINLLHNNQDYETATALLDRVIQLHPENAELHTRRGDLWHESGRYEEAIASYDRALEDV